MADITLIHDCDAERRETPGALNGDFRDCWIDEEPLDGQGNKHDATIVIMGVTVLGGKGSEYEQRGLFRYDLRSFIPAGATLTAAVWWINVYATDASAYHPFRACRIRRHDWKEDEATWIVYKTGSNWGNPGASDTTTDRDTTTPGYVALGTIETTGWHAITGVSPIYILDLVEDAWDNRDGICTFIVERYSYLTQEGSVTIYAKAPPEFGGPTFLCHHLRVTYTLDGRTFQAFVH